MTSEKYEEEGAFYHLPEDFIPDDTITAQLYELGAVDITRAGADLAEYALREGPTMEHEPMIWSIQVDHHEFSKRITGNKQRFCGVVYDRQNTVLDDKLFDRLEETITWCLKNARKVTPPAANNNSL